ncbi:Flp family type IVb pilin [Stappia sp.]|jgi:Flp pilus assembly pilin Flp|uniref:Flp family type IVb pilin n=1 Tax=Stappia sp. TaxID=1870903 RepID=UPI003A99E99D
MQFHRDASGGQSGLSSGTVRTFLRDESGETAVEYTLIVGLISLAIFTALSSIATVLNDDVFGVIASAAASI